MRYSFPQPLLKHALALHQLGFSVIPLRPQSKKPLVPWKRFQRHRPSQDTVRDWFQDVDNLDRGLAAVLGQVSGGLLCRDFDSQASFKAWKRSHPELARILPVVLTSRGAHVYCRCEGYLPEGKTSFVKKLPDGELRGDESYTVLPPSLHEKTGEPYRWRDGRPPLAIPILPLDELGFLPHTAHVTQVVYGLPGLPAAAGACLPLPPPPACLRPSNLAEAIARTLPNGIGQRNRCIFEFARHLKAMEQYANARQESLVEAFRQWHDRALPFIGTKDFDWSLWEFLRAWELVRIPVGSGSLANALKRAKSAPLPPEAKQFPSERMQLLVKLCRELQRENGERPFFLGSRQAAKAIGLTGKEPHVTAYRWLKILCDESVGILEFVGSGSFRAKRTNEYRYKPAIEDRPAPIHKTIAALVLVPSDSLPRTALAAVNPNSQESSTMPKCINLWALFGKRFHIGLDTDPVEPKRSINARKVDPWLQVVLCKHGHIYPHGGKMLGVATDSRGAIVTKISRLQGVTVAQDGADGINAIFPLELFDQVAAIVKPKLRRRLSPEHRQKAGTAGTAALKKHRTANSQDGFEGHSAV